ncbi:MAG: prolyl oligopeptidase family serine peptidase, partial [Firmicutes bacterium]|nr:prolyl oligopeptidase family serine peptidase [Bacillota bacterium]
PITYVENMKTPVMIEHQEGDLRCPIEQGEMLYTALKYLNQAPVKFVRYPHNEFHGMSRNGKPWHRVYRLHTLVEWFDRYLK